MEELLTNPHPGDILKHEFLDEIGISGNKLAEFLGVPGNRVNDLIRGKRRVTADTDLRLCRFFSLSEGYFLRLQNAYDVMEAKRKAGDSIDNVAPFRSADTPRTA